MTLGNSTKKKKKKNVEFEEKKRGSLLFSCRRHKNIVAAAKTVAMRAAAAVGFAASDIRTVNFVVVGATPTVVVTSCVVVHTSAVGESVGAAGKKANHACLHNARASALLNAEEIPALGGGQASVMETLAAAPVEA